MIGTPCSARRLTAWPRTLRPISCRSRCPASEALQSLGPKDAADTRYPIPRNAAAQIAQGAAEADAARGRQVPSGGRMASWRGSGQRGGER